MVATQLANAIKWRGRPEAKIASAWKGWPEVVPDILICTPNAAAKGLRPCTGSDEIARAQALKRIRDVEMVAFDEVDLVMHGPDSSYMKDILVAIAASWPKGKRRISPEAQVYRPEGQDVEVYDPGNMKWRKAKARQNRNGTLQIEYLDNGNFVRWMRRAFVRGPGIGMLVENGPRFVAVGATIPSFNRACVVTGRNAGRSQGTMFRGGIGSASWVLKRWFPQAYRITSPYINARHPCLAKEEWLYIEGEYVADSKRNIKLQTRIQMVVDILEKQGTEIRTIIFASCEQHCKSLESALTTAGINFAPLHQGVGFKERLNSLKRFASREVNLLTCTDLASRGLDLPSCQHVIQLETAWNATDYLHRVGRTTRAAQSGQVTNLWGKPDRAVHHAVLHAPSMGMRGEIVSRLGNQWRLKRTRRKFRNTEAVFESMRAAAREAKKRI